MVGTDASHDPVAYHSGGHNTCWSPELKSSREKVLSLLSSSSQETAEDLIANRCSHKGHCHMTNTIICNTPRASIDSTIDKDGHERSALLTLLARDKPAKHVKC